MKCSACNAAAQNELVCLRCGQPLYSETIVWLQGEREHLLKEYGVVLEALRRGLDNDSRPLATARGIVDGLPNHVSATPYDALTVAAAVSAGPLECCYSYVTRDGTTTGEYSRRNILRPFETVGGTGSHFAIFRVSRVFSLIWPEWRENSAQ